MTLSSRLLKPIWRPHASNHGGCVLLEIGHLHMVRRIARLRLGLTPREEAQVPAPTPAPAGTVTPTATQQASSDPSVVGQPSLRLSSVVDPTLDSLLVRLPGHQIRGFFTKYATARGAEPSDDIEPSSEQISALHQILAADLPPYVDFGIFGPHGRRMLNKLTYVRYTHLPNGAWQRNILPGPSTFDLWWASYRVLRCALLLLEAVPPEVLDAYGEFIREQNQAYGNDAWFLVYQADVRMRSEQFDRLRRRAERQHQLEQADSFQSHFDPAKPWATVFHLALADKMWWDEHLHRPVVMFLAKIRSRAQVCDDGTTQPALASIDGPPGRSGGRNNNNNNSTRRNNRSRTPRRQQQPGGGSSTITTARGKPFCTAYNSPAGCSHSQQSCQYFHGCTTCRKTGHSALNCDPNRGASGGKADSRKQKRKGGGKGK